MPPKSKSGVGVGLDVFGFAGSAPVAVDDEAGVVHFFQVDHAGADAARRQLGGGEGDGFGLVDFFGGGVFEPGVELGEGGGVELGDFEGAFCVLLGLGGVVCAAGGEDVFGGHCSCRCGWDDGGDEVGWFEEWP